MDKFARVPMALPPGSTQSSFSSLEHLPVEIQIHILKSLPDAKTLGSLLRASPQYLQVYQGVHEEIFSHIVCKQITPALLPLAIQVLQQSCLRSRRRPRSKVLEFLKTFKEPQSTSSQITLSLETCKMLLKTHTAVEHFTDAFVTDRLNLLSEYIPRITLLLAQGNASLGILGIEHHRLTRAFYHLELYGSLFYDPEVIDDVITAQEQSSLFLAKLSDWEIEELLCIREYLLESLTTYLDQVEQDFIQDYFKGGPPTDIARNIRDIRFNDNDGWWYFFSRIGHGARIQERWMEGRLAGGLKALQEILKSHTTDKRYDPLGDLRIDHPLNTMKQALNQLSYLQDETESPQFNITGTATFINSLESANIAWTWALDKWGHPRKPRARSFRWAYYQVLRRWGYLIWSNETLRILGLLENRQSTDWEYKQGVLVIHSYRAEDLIAQFCKQKRRRVMAVETRVQTQYERWRKEAL